ncbi:hypothetical protein FUAX_29550 [Fulvitalea axinellae]|uniref:Uncharacterized protein n=1 Tax=Fulvitalea axinellae TaxID=1182444 RepID=A0AAU9D3I1_9BACT|nr:hypothetical protein FUAX_29550 [Fulvitalea axinellae]
MEKASGFANPLRMAVSEKKHLQHVPLGLAKPIVVIKPLPANAGRAC